MTEAFGPYCGYPADTDMPRSAWGSCGKPFPGMEVRIADPDSGQPVAAGTIGMIQIRGPHTLRGICRRSREELFTADGFYPTGDLGRLDDDGFLFYHGRSDDMFKVSGATVYPTEVEQALRDIDGVENAFVTNVPWCARRSRGRRSGVRYRRALPSDCANRPVNCSARSRSRRYGCWSTPTTRFRAADRQGRHPAAARDVDWCGGHAAGLGLVDDPVHGEVVDQRRRPRGQVL